MNRTLALLAMSMFAMTGAAWAAGGSYDDDDPFDETRRFDHFQRLGGNLAEEQDIEFIFSFADSLETRAEHAQQFANKLRHKGYPKAQARPCYEEKACWLVYAPKRMRLDLKKTIALSKELDQLAADDYGRYDGWTSALFKREDEKIRSAMSARSNQVPTLGTWLLGIDQGVAFQCSKMQDSLRGLDSAADTEGKRLVTRGAIDMICTCMPERLKEMRIGLLPLERESQISEAEVTKSYFMPKVIEPCSARMVRKMYGEDCPALAADRKVDAPAYCGCMQQFVNEMSEADLAQLGLITADYLPQVAQAKKNGTTPPEPPPLFAKFTSREAACRK